MGIKKKIKRRATKKKSKIDSNSLTMEVFTELEAYKHRKPEDKMEREYGPEFLDLSGPPDNIINYLLKNKKLAHDFKRFLKNEKVTIEDFLEDSEYDEEMFGRELIKSAVVRIKPLTNNKYKITLFINNEIEELEYQFTTDYKGLIDFIQHT